MKLAQKSDLTHPTPEKILMAGGEGGAYAIECVQTPDGPRFRLGCDETYIDMDHSSRQAWMPSLKQAVEAMPPYWVNLYPSHVAPEHAGEFWMLYVAGMQRLENSEHRSLTIEHWTKVLLGQSFTAMDEALAFVGRTTHWLPFTARLRSALSQMQEDQFLVLTLKETNRFVQFAAQGAQGMRAEATSNHFLSGWEQLDAGQVRGLLKLGWHKPTGNPKQATPEHDPQGSSNFFLQIPNPIDYAKLATLAVRTLSGVFGVPHEGLLQYAAYDYAGNTLALPGLQIKREQRDPTLKMAELADRLLAVVREITDLHKLDFDADGDIALWAHGLPLYIRLVGQPPMVRFFSPLLDNVRPSRKLLELVNHLNLNGGPTRHVMHKNAVLAVLDIPAWPLQADHVAHSLERITASLQSSSAWLNAELGAHISKIRTRSH